MGLFQQSVLNKYLKESNQDQMQKAWKKFTAWFQNPVIQQNIRDSKEEQFQEGFLTELFVKIFGYTINPNPDYNLTTEFKNERGAKKADGAILSIEFPGDHKQGVATPCSSGYKQGVTTPCSCTAVGVIELKSTTTKDLESIRLQAFDYKANHSKCVYVITSNFEKIRFYIHNAVEFEEFDLFRLNYQHFQVMWLCMAKDNLLRGLPLKMKEASILKEENITKQIYVDYSLFKRDLYSNLVANNLNIELFSGKEEKEIKLLLFKKSQKLLDRFLFILFSEDRGLLPPNSISQIIKQWENQSDWGDNVKLYDRYKKYFHLLNTGWKGKKYEIFAYNGGLFAPDEILDHVEINDEVLKKHTEVLTSYDFETEVDVNILGHIFENSLNEIEELTAQILAAEPDDANNESINKGLQPLADIRQTIVDSDYKGLQSLADPRQPLADQSNKGLQSLADPKKPHQSATISKRKKDGVFYTPKYITKYIVENTIGKLCDEKKNQLAIDESEYLKSRRGRTTKKLKELDRKLEEYRNWLLSLTVCDPACGSGAFLNQALDFLIHEHRYIDELRAKLLDVPIVFTEVENSILENNIYGVDINEESVEIAKLSLWLRTAQKGRKLSTLSNNIKCGNSLIDDVEVAGEKAFNWQTEFPEIFQKKKKGAWHVTWVTHDTRTSERMKKHKVREPKANGEMYVDRSVYLTNEDELKVTEIITDIVAEKNYNCLAFSINTDHVHMLLVCEEDELINIVRKLKGKSAQLFKEYLGLEKEETFHLWAQKFDRKFIQSEQQLVNTIKYIQNNKEKHQRHYCDEPDHQPDSELQEIAKQGVVTPCSTEDTERMTQQGVVTPCSYEKKQTSSEGERLSHHHKAATLCPTEDSKSILQHEVPTPCSSDAHDDPAFQKQMQLLVKKMTCSCKHAFRTEYKGGFDVVIGNPPYGASLNSDIKELLIQNYECFRGNFDIYSSFIQLAYLLLKSHGYWSYINPVSWQSGDNYLMVRKYLEKNGKLIVAIKLPYDVFVDAYVDTGIYVIRKTKSADYTSLVYEFPARYKQLGDLTTDIKLKKLPNKYWTSIETKQIVLNPAFYELLPKIFKNSFPLNDISSSTRGILPRKEDVSDSPTGKKLFFTGGLYRYKIQKDFLYVNYGDHLKEKPKDYSFFQGGRILIRRLINRQFQIMAAFVSDEFVNKKDLYNLKITDEKFHPNYLLAIINSKLISFLKIRGATTATKDDFGQITLSDIRQIPIKPASIEKQREFSSIVNDLLEKIENFNRIQNNFNDLICSKFNIRKLSQKLHSWYELNFSDFLKELKKAKVKLTLSEEAEWMLYFNEQKQKAQVLKSEIDETDREIDRMVYELYGLTEEEINVVEEK